MIGLAYETITKRKTVFEVDKAYGKMKIILTELYNLYFIYVYASVTQYLSIFLYQFKGLLKILP